jgi:hypothetical protein
VGDKGASALGRCLEHNKALISLIALRLLNLWPAERGLEGGRGCLCPAACQSVSSDWEGEPTLGQLWPRRWRLWGRRCGRRGLHARLLLSTPTPAAALLSLPASQNQVGDKGASALAKGLEHNKVLTSLNLWCAHGRLRWDD